MIKFVFFSKVLYCASTIDNDDLVDTKKHIDIITYIYIYIYLFWLDPLSVYDVLVFVFLMSTFYSLCSDWFTNWTEEKQEGDYTQTDEIDGRQRVKWCVMFSPLQMGIDVGKTLFLDQYMHSLEVTMKLQQISQIKKRGIIFAQINSFAS